MSTKGIRGTGATADATPDATAGATGGARRRPVLGAVLAAAVAVGGAVAANAATQGAAPASRGGTPPPISSIVSDCASMGTVLSAGASATAAGASADTVHGARGRAALVARSTTDDEVRERAQNLADDLAAYRVAVAATAPAAAGSAQAADQARRRADIGVMVREDLTALRRLCAR